MPNKRRNRPRHRKKNKVGLVDNVPVTSSSPEQLPDYEPAPGQIGLQAVDLSKLQNAIECGKKDKAGCDIGSLDKEPGINDDELCKFYSKLDAASASTKSITELGHCQKMTGEPFVKETAVLMERRCSDENFEEVIQGIDVENEPPMKSGGLMKKNGKTKWTNINPEFVDYNFKSTSTLFEGETCEAVVSEMEKYSFVAVVKENVRVIVHSNCFYPRGFKEPLEKNMPVACFLKIGDHVKLRATKVITGYSKNTNHIKWFAQECWKEDLSEIHESTPEADNMESQSTIISVDNKSLQLKDGTVTHADAMFLFGFRLAHGLLNLKDIFLPGDKISYIVDRRPSKYAHTLKVVKAWYGSLPDTEEGNEPSHQQQFQLMQFLKTRCKGSSVQIVTSVCSLNKKAEAAEDGFEKLYNDIFSEEGAAGCKVEKNSSILTEKQLNIPKTELNHKNDKKQAEYTHVQFKNREFEEEYSRFLIAGNTSFIITHQPITKASLVDASTQTHATGEIVCFYNIHNDESD